MIADEDGAAPPADAWAELRASLQRTMDAIMAALQAFWEAVRKALQPLMDALVETLRAVDEAGRRHTLHARLRRWRVPGRLAGWLAARCPLAWLPPPDWESLCR